MINSNSHTTLYKSAENSIMYKYNIQIKNILPLAPDWSHFLIIEHYSKQVIRKHNIILRIIVISLLC